MRTTVQIAGFLLAWLWLVPLLAQNRGDGTATYDLIEGSIKVDGELTFTSLNKKVDEFQASRDDPNGIVTTNKNIIRTTDMVPLFIEQIYSISSTSTNGYHLNYGGWGLKGEVVNGQNENVSNPPGSFPNRNGIFFTMYAYDKHKADGKGIKLYQCYLTNNASEYENYYLQVKRAGWFFGTDRYSCDIDHWVIKKLGNYEGYWKNSSWKKQVVPVILEVRIKNATLKGFNIPGLKYKHLGTFFKVENDKKMFLNPRSHDGYIQFASHRGTLRKYPENTLPGIQESLQIRGIDQIEIDMDRTSDGVIVLMHAATTMKRYTNSSAEIKHTPWSTVQNLYYKDRLGRIWNGNNGTQPLHVARLKDILPHLKDRVMIHMDKTEKYIDKVLDISEPLGMTHQMIFKGKQSPKQLWEKYSSTTHGYDNRHGDILKKINYLPVAFSFSRAQKATDVGLSSGATWKQIFNKWYAHNEASYNILSSLYPLRGCVRGFETQWFSDFRDEDVKLINAIPDLKVHNMNSLSSPVFVEDYVGIWIPKLDTWMRWNPLKDHRYDYDFWYDIDPDDPSSSNPGSSGVDQKSLPDMVISNGEYRLLPYLKQRGFKNIPDRFK